MDKTKQLVGRRVSDRSLTVEGPEYLVEDFTEHLVQVDGIFVVTRTPGDGPESVGSTTFLFSRQAKRLLTLLPPVGTSYLLGLQFDPDFDLVLEEAQ